ncbi:MAG: hypothetical protein NTW27_13260 [Deltaproteobacteria bacterium]|nr:hypothetical protein [Deltaproteobacteria bacterium]
MGHYILYFQGQGIATFVLHYLIEIAEERGIKGFRGDVIFGNQPILRVYDSVPYAVHKTFEDGVVDIRFSFDEKEDAKEQDCRDK